MSRAEQKALNELREMVNQRTIRISSADKGGAIVIQNTTDYIEEAQNQLSKSAHYETVKKDPTVSVAKTSNRFVEELHEKGHIDDKTYKWAKIEPNHVSTHRFYTLPKIHKTLSKPPGRPIVSGLNGPTEKLSKLVDHWLQSYVNMLPSHIKDSTHMLQIIDEWNRKLGPFDNNTRLVTIDVSALYTNIPHDDLKTALLSFLQNATLPTIPPPADIVNITDHVLKNNFFSFEGTVYRQVLGTAMGTPMAPSAANLFMGWLEKQLLSNSPVFIPDEVWKRFIDDIIILWQHSQEDLDAFTAYNSFHPTIKFTVSSSSDQIPFLDILLSFENGYLQTDLYSKPTDSHAYLHSLSCHPQHTINSLPFGLFLRLRRLCSTQDKFIKHSNELEGQLIARGHKQSTIEKARHKAQSLSRSECLQYKTQSQNKRVPFVVTHNPSNPPLRGWLGELHNTMQSTSERMRLAVPLPPVVGERETAAHSGHFSCLPCCLLQGTRSLDLSDARARTASSVRSILWKALLSPVIRLGSPSTSGTGCHVQAPTSSMCCSALSAKRSSMLGKHKTHSKCDFISIAQISTKIEAHWLPSISICRTTAWMI